MLSLRSTYVDCGGQCPLRSESGRTVHRPTRSALCHKQTNGSAANCSLFNHLVGRHVGIDVSLELSSRSQRRLDQGGIRDASGPNRGPTARSPTHEDAPERITAERKRDRNRDLLNLIIENVPVTSFHLPPEAADRRNCAAKKRTEIPPLHRAN